MADIFVPIDKLGEAIEDDAEKKVRKIILAVFANLDSASPLGRPELWQGKKPVDYRPGWFKANWHVLLFRKTAGQPVPENARGNITPSLKLYKLGKQAAIINNAPYAERLGEGYSSQAPIGWIDAAIKSGVKSVLR